MSMMDRLRYELRGVGWGTLALPLVVIVVFLGVAALAVYDTLHTGGSAERAHHDFAFGMLLLVEVGVPPVCGIAAAFLIASNPARELHFSLPVPYRVTMEWRLVLFALWSAVVCALASAAILGTGFWLAPQPTPLNQLTWVAPLLWFIGCGAALALLLGNWVAAGSVVGVTWLGVLFLRWYFFQHTSLHRVYLFLTLSTIKGAEAPDASYWLSNRLTLIGMSVTFLALVALLLRRSQAILGHEA